MVKNPFKKNKNQESKKIVKKTFFGSAENPLNQTDQMQEILDTRRKNAQGPDVDGKASNSDPDPQTTEKILATLGYDSKQVTHLQGNGESKKENPYHTLDPNSQPCKIEHSQDGRSLPEIPEEPIYSNGHDSDSHDSEDILTFGEPEKNALKALDEVLNAYDENESPKQTNTNNKNPNSDGINVQK